MSLPSWVTGGKKRKRESKTNEGNEIDNQCRGLTLAGDRCQSDFRRGHLYCAVHAKQEIWEAEGRFCDFTTKEGTPCLTPMPPPGDGKPDKEKFCKRHSTVQIGYPGYHYEMCQGVKADGDRCPNFVKSTQPVYLCHRHMDQVGQRVPDLTNVPDDIWNCIVKDLTPVERVAFALTCRASAAFLRTWGSTSTRIKHEDLPILIKNYAMPPAYYVLVVEKDQVELTVSEHGFCSKPMTQVASRNVPDSANRVVKACNKCRSLTRIYDHRTQDYGSATATLDAPLFTIHKRAASATGKKTRHREDHLCIAWRNHNWLFDGIEPICMVCKDTDTRGGLLCEYCYARNSIFLRWCKYCRGKPSTLDLARAYWATQPKHEVRLAKDEANDDEDAEDEDEQTVDDTATT